MKVQGTSFKKIYLKLHKLTKATCTVYADGVGMEEIAWIDGRAAQVVAINGKEVTLQVFSGTEGLSTNSEVIFTGKSSTMICNTQIAGRFLDAYGHPMDGGPELNGEETELSNLTVNPVKRAQPSELIETLLPGIDINNTLVSGQKIPFFADPDQPFNIVLANIAINTKADRIILGGMGLDFDDFLMFKNMFQHAGILNKVTSFINTTQNPTIERLLIPDAALTAAEYFAHVHKEKVLVLLTDMTLYADALAIVSNKMEQIPSKDSMPGSLYSDLARLYERAVQFQHGGSITILAVTTLSQGDITHAIPDNTGYITEGQLYLKFNRQVNKVIVDPFRSLSRLKQLVIAKKTREDHAQVLNASVRLYADAAEALTKLENGFDLSEYDKRAINFAKDYAANILGIDVRKSVNDALDKIWELIAENFTPEETGIKKQLLDKYWPKYA
ncbi:MAG: V-type ATP synthase subunit B [Bacteroidia bacterium]